MSGDFLDVPSRAIRIRDRAVVASANLRKPEYLPPLEIQKAIKQVLIENLGGKKEEIPSEIAKRLGVNVVSTQLKEAIFGGLDELHNG